VEWYLHSPTCLHDVVLNKQRDNFNLPRHDYVGESGGIAPSFFIFGSRWRGVACFTTLPLYPQGKGPQYTLYRRSKGASLDTVEKRKMM
jgi:hypothetical protein